VEDDFGPALVAVVEVLVGVGGFGQGKLVGDDEGRVGLAVVDEFHEAAVVGFDVALTGAHLLAFEPELPEVEGNLSFFGEGVCGTRVLRDEDTDDAEDAGGFDGVDQGVHDHVGDFFAGGVVALIADAFGAAIRAEAAGVFADLFGDVVIGGVDGGGAKLFGEGEAVGFVVDDEDLAGSLDSGGERCHEADGTGSVDDDGLAGLELGEAGGVPAGGEDVGEHDVVLLLFGGIFGELETVEVGVGDTEVLGLAAGVGPHAGESVGGSGHAGHDRGVGAGETEAGEAALAVCAEAAADIEGEDDLVALLDGVHSAADGDDFAEVFVAEDLAFFNVGAAFVHVEVGAADVGGGELDDDVGVLFDLGVGDGVDADFFRSVIDECFHGFLSKGFGLRVMQGCGHLLAQMRSNDVVSWVGTCRRAFRSAYGVQVVRKRLKLSTCGEACSGRVMLAACGLRCGWWLVGWCGSLLCLWFEKLPKN
jgi:hypothetical protein